MHDECTLRRIESHTLFMRESGAGDALRGLGFTGVPRHFLTKSLATVSRSRVGAGITIEPLTLQRRRSVGHVMYRSMVGSLDAAINADFESAEGCQRNLEALMVWPAWDPLGPSGPGPSEPGPHGPSLSYGPAHLGKAPMSHPSYAPLG